MSDKFLGLFEGYGIELEYMIVSQETLRVLPIADQLFFDLTGNKSGEAIIGEVGISNELANHLIEFKCVNPVSTISTLAQSFTEVIQVINQKLEKYGAVLMPTAMHPFMIPSKESGLWRGEDVEIYKMYHRIFNCKRHGWLNVQSMHINLPFLDQSQFERLHAAIRLVLPLVPVLAASSPLVEGSKGIWQNNRILYYLKNQEKIPAITGSVIPEPVFSMSKYQELVLNKMYSAISSHDPQGVLQHEWLNSRGAIARFDRQTIEIRLADVQECPAIDIAIANFLVAIIRLLVDGQFIQLRTQKLFSEKLLYKILLDNARLGRQNVIVDEFYLSAFGLARNKCSVKDFLLHLFDVVIDRGFFDDDSAAEIIHFILLKGNLSERILEVMKNHITHDGIVIVYRQLINCLENNVIFKELGDES